MTTTEKENAMSQTLIGSLVAVRGALARLKRTGIALTFEQWEAIELLEERITDCVESPEVYKMAAKTDDANA